MTTPAGNSDRWILKYACPDVAGLQAAVTTLLFEHGAFVEEVAAYSDPDTTTFFSRIVFRSTNADAPLDIVAVRAAYEPVAERFEMDWDLVDAAAKMKVVIAASQSGHCLNDLLHRWASGGLPIEIKAVVSNHEALREMTEWRGLPFHHVPITKQTKLEAETEFYRLVQSYDAELVVLARYMQVLSDGLAAKLAGRCINIHHSFLPGFKGARPYHQAHRRGVKIIGATAHYVTSELDEGPIIEQDVERVDHALSPSQLMEVGQDIERRVLARAVKWHATHRILLNGARTVVFK
ncbi:MAG: formyltetrahydrofolate deformylase [Maricaulaceae bacterium]|jgi:formyltetrahydrofolate deformylase